MKEPLLIVEDSAFFKKGQLLESYEVVDDGIEANGNFIKESQYLVLKEHLSPADQKIIKELVRAQFKKMFWNLYTKQSIILQ